MNWWRGDYGLGEPAKFPSGGTDLLLVLEPKLPIPREAPQVHTRGGVTRA